MKRPYKRIITMILACVMIAVSVIGAAAAHTERTLYYGNLNGIRCVDLNSTRCIDSCGKKPDCVSGVDSGLCQILRQLGCSEELCQKVLNQLGGCNQIKNDGTQSNSCSPQAEQPASTEKEIPIQAPTQAPATEPISEDTEAPVIPTEAPTAAAEVPTVQPTAPATDAPTPPTEAPAQPPTEAPAPQQSQALNAYELEVVRLINEIRAQYGLSELKVNTELSRVARIKSQDMHDKGYFSHNSPTYGSPFDMMKQFGIKYRTAGENIAMGYRNPQSVVNGWMNSPGHRANILNGSFREIGMGYIASGNYWTQMFIG